MVHVATYVRQLRKRAKYLMLQKHFIKYPPFKSEVRNSLITSSDPVRYSTLALAISTIRNRNIPGAFAELGVYKARTSKLIHRLAPEKTFYLFDTFRGFPNQNPKKQDSRFQDTSLEEVKKYLGDLSNIIFKPGVFPETAKGLEKENFALVILDADKYQPTCQGLDFFYRRLSPGGYIFVHDYNSPESDGAVARAVSDFLKNNPALFIEIPDVGGSVVLRKT